MSDPTRLKYKCSYGGDHIGLQYRQIFNKAQCSLVSIYFNMTFAKFLYILLNILQ